MSIYHQVHLDFHTSELIPDIGAEFNADNFGDQVKDAGVDAIVLFAKCHHGWAYYNTEIGERHPNLEFDLLQAQYDACKERGIAVKIYYSIGWDERAARLNPGWRRILPDGQFHMMLGRNLEPWWSYLCLNTPYKEYIIKQSDELARRFSDADGFWFDIIREHECCCNYCRAGMDEAGLDWTNFSDRKKYARQVRESYQEASLAAARAVNPQMPVFQNTSMAPRGDRRFYEGQDVVEIEAVPTGGWGYDHFPISASYLSANGYPTMGVTTRFHIVWGELGGMKHPNALQAEAAMMLAHGSAVCIGDHMDTNGVLDQDAWSAIKQTFATTKPVVEKVFNSKPAADIGLLSSIAVRSPGSMLRVDRDCIEDEGAHRILTQAHQQFDIIDADSDFGKYDILVLPDSIQLDETLSEKINTFVASGGGLLLSGESGLSIDGSRLMVDAGLELHGRSPFNPTYVKPDKSLSPEYVNEPFSLFAPSYRIKATTGQSLGDVYEPYFQRGPRGFSGHINTPRRQTPSGFHSGVKNGRIIYLPHKLFTLYKTYGHVSTREYVNNAIKLLQQKGPLVRTNAPSAATVSLREKNDQSGLLLQIVYAPKELRGQSLLGAIEVVEDLPTLNDLTFDVAIKQEVTSIRALRSGDILTPARSGARIAFTLGQMTGSEIIEIEYLKC